MAKWDLTPVLAPYLDRHLVFPLLEFLREQKIYNSRDLLQSEFYLLGKTKMVDYSIDISKLLSESDVVPEYLTKRRQEVISEMQELQNQSEDIVTLLANPEVTAELNLQKDFKVLTETLSTKFGFQVEKMDSIYKLSKYLYECGDYTRTVSYLYFYLLVMNANDKNYLSVLWGKLASEILTQNWDSALEDLNKIREYIENNAFSTPLQSLQQRTWVIHWSLFIFFHHEKGKDLIIEFLYSPKYLNAIQTMCPHILRYLATAVILNRTRRNCLKDLIKAIQQESYTYRDPITEFLEHLYVNFDFEGARQKLHECHEVVSKDFFLVACLNDFIENARLMIFETFCRIHQCISIKMLAEKLNMKPDEAECWIVNLIRNARLDAKIDSKHALVVMGMQPLSPYQQLLEKVDTLSVKSEAIQALLERKIKSRTGDIRWGPQDFNN